MPTNILAGSIATVTVRITDDDNTPRPTPRPSLPDPPTTGNDDNDNDRDDRPGGGGTGGGGFFGGFGGGSGAGGTDSEGDGDGGGYSGPNRPPYFNEGVSTDPSVTEHTNRAVYLGDPVTATDPDGDVLTYALGGRDADSFALDSHTGQLITKAVLVVRNL